MRKSTRNRFICSMCLPDVKEIGEIVPGMWLGLDKADGKYVIVFDPHGCEIIHRFKKTPWIDPLEQRPGETGRQWAKRYDSSQEALFERNLSWGDMARRELGRTIHLDDLMRWASAVRAGGWRRQDGSVSVWIYARCARLVERAAKRGR